jgi:hypothetical protein
MQWAALIAWLLTALGGLTLFLQWIRHGGRTQTEGIRLPRLLTHMTIAVAGFLAWIIYLVTDETWLAWTAVGLLLAVASLGVWMLMTSTRGRTSFNRTATPAEGMFPLPLVALHGVLAATTTALAILAAAGIGT